MNLAKENISDSQPEWKMHQDHDEYVQDCLDKSGSSFRKFNGKKFWNIMKQLGHTSMDFHKCECHKKTDVCET